MKCTNCKIEKIEIEFSFRNKLSNIRQKVCKTCTRGRIKLHYSQNRQYYLDKARKRNYEVRIHLRKYIWNYLTNSPCVDCGEKDPVVLEFDHIRDKLMDISKLIQNVSSLERLKDEINKCQVRCANCHRRKTAKDFGWLKATFALVAQLD